MTKRIFKLRNVAMIACLAVTSMMFSGCDKNNDNGTIVPTAPTNFTATAGDGQVTLSWSAPTSDGGSAITKYEVLKSDDGEWKTASSTTGHIFTGLTNSEVYNFKVRTVNANGKGAIAETSAKPEKPGGPITSETAWEYLKNLVFNAELYVKLEAENLDRREIREMWAVQGEIFYKTWEKYNEYPNPSITLNYLQKLGNGEYNVWILYPNYPNWEMTGTVPADIAIASVYGYLGNMHLHLANPLLKPQSDSKIIQGKECVKYIVPETDVVAWFEKSTGVCMEIRNFNNEDYDCTQFGTSGVTLPEHP